LRKSFAATEFTVCGDAVVNGMVLFPSSYFRRKFSRLLAATVVAIIIMMAALGFLTKSGRR
jgi:hypothetical protein